MFLKRSVKVKIIKKELKMDKHMLDIFSVVVIMLIACTFILRTYLKMRKNKCLTMCNGCSGGVCSKRSFATSGTKIIKISPKF